MTNGSAHPDEQQLLEENAQLRAALAELRDQLKEPEEILRAIRLGEIDALVVQEAEGDQIYWVKKADELYRSMIEDLLPYGVWVADADGNLRYASRSFLELLGMTMDEAKGFGFTRSLRAEDVGAYLQQWMHCVQTGERWDREAHFLGTDSKYHAVLSRASAVRNENGRVVCWVGMNLDIDERKAMEEQLRRQAEELAERDRRKDEFLALLGHELRNPLAPLRNGLHILKTSGTDGALAIETMELMERQLRLAVRLVDDLLDMSRITRGKIRLQKAPMALSKVVGCAMELSRHLFDMRKQDFRVALPEEAIWVNVDLSRMTQVIGNLLNNASKFTPEGGRVALTAERQGEYVVLRVADEGVGMSADALPHIFDLFVQSAGTLADSQGGLGIGLTLVKRLVEMHGGTVSASSSGVGKGSQFTLTIPVLDKKPRPQQPREVAAGPAQVAPRRVLLVEDNADAASSLALILKLAGHEVRTARDGKAALAAAREFVPEVVLLDIGLPGMTGYEVAKRLREDGSSPLIVAMTGYGQEADRRRSREAGIVMHLVKPIDPNEIEAFLAGVGQDPTPSP